MLLLKLENLVNKKILGILIIIIIIVVILGMGMGIWILVMEIFRLVFVGKRNIDDYFVFILLWYFIYYWLSNMSRYLCICILNKYQYEK